MPLKLRIVYLPFFIIAITFISLYTFFDWLLFIKLNLFSINEDIINYWLILILVWVPILKWLSPRIKILKITGGRGNGPFLYQFIACFAIAIPTIIAQAYLESATGKLTQLKTISEIDLLPFTKYYTIDHFYIDQVNNGSFTDVTTSGKNNEYLDFALYFVCPVLSSKHSSSDSSKLYILDGEPINGEELRSLNIPKNDVESIVVLKDSTATKLYGAIGENGAVVITTKENYSDSARKPEAEGEIKAWMGIKFTKQISNRGSDQEKENEFNEFVQASNRDFSRKNLYAFNYLERLGNTNDHDGFRKALKESRLYKSENSPILIPIDQPFENRNGHKLGWIFGSLGIGAIVWLFMTLIPGIDKKELKNFLSKKQPKKKEPQFILSLIVPREGFFATALIIDMNVIVFMLMVLSGCGFISFRADDLITWGANSRSLTLNGQAWRLLSSMFLHAGLMHLFANMVGLIFVSILLEPFLGKTRYGILYLVTGIVAGMTSLMWHDVISVGASGAIFGMYGIFLALLSAKVFPKEMSSAFLGSTLLFIGYNLLMGLGGGVDNAAHIGGLTSGFILGLFLSPTLRNQSANRKQKET